MEHFNPKTKYIIEQKIFRIKEFYEYNDDYITRPAYKRKNVWSIKKQHQLLDSLFRRYYIPKIVMREIRLDENNSIYEVIDGQQRIITAQNYFAGKIKLPKSLIDIDVELPGKVFSDLSTKFKRFIDKELDYKADIIKGISDPKNIEHQKIATEIFWRLQQGESLNYMEIAHAKLSSLVRNFIVCYSDDIDFDFKKYIPIDHNKKKHKFFKIIDSSNNRMQHLMLMARLILLEKNDGISELNDKAVENLIDEYENEKGIGNYCFEENEIAKKVLSNLNLFYNIFKNDTMLDEKSGMKEFRREYFIISIYLLLRHLKTYYVFKESEKKLFFDFVLEFYKRWRKNDEEDLDIISFTSNRQQGQNNVEIRHRITRQLFFEYVKSNDYNMIILDEKRAFNEAERILIYRKNKGLCQMCIEEGKLEKESSVSWSEYEADHILPHSRGGRTIEFNGQVLCKYHNLKKSDKL